MRCRSLRLLIAPSLLLAAALGAPRVVADDDAVLTKPLPAPVFSPFGERVAAAIGPEGAGAVVVVGIKAEPASVEVLTRLSADPATAHPRWSADGRRLAWSAGAAAMVATVGEKGAEPEKRPFGKPIAEYDPTSDWAVVAHAVYSPDGDKVAFVVPRGKGVGTFCAPLVGGATVRLSEEPARAIAWNADSDRVAIAVPGGITVIGADGKGRQGIAKIDDAGPVAVRFAEDGERLLAFVGDRLRAYPLEGRAGEGTPIGDAVSAVAVAFAPKKDWLAIVTDRGVLWTLAAADGKLDQVTERGARVMSAPAWSPDGTRLATLEFGGPGEVALGVHGTDGDGKRIPLFFNPTKRPAEGEKKKKR